MLNNETITSFLKVYKWKIFKWIIILIMVKMFHWYTYENAYHKGFNDGFYYWLEKRQQQLKDKDEENGTMTFHKTQQKTTINYIVGDVIKYMDLHNMSVDDAIIKVAKSNEMILNQKEIRHVKNVVMLNKGVKV